MLSLIIDGNYLLNKVIRLLYAERSLYNPADPDMIPKETPFIAMELELALYNIVQKMKRLAMWSNVYIVADAPGNWRKKKFPEYKAKRKKDDSIDWDIVYECYDNWKQGMSELPNFKVLWQSGLEGDDWMAYITHKENSQGGSCVIATGDGDMNQLVRCGWNEPKWINIQWKDFFSNYSFFMPHDYREWMADFGTTEAFDVFNMDTRTNASQEVVTKIEDAYSFETVYWKEFLFKKLIEGDKSDNVASVLTKEQNMKNGSIRHVGIGPGTSEKIWSDYVALYGDDPDLESEEFIEELVPIVLDRMKVKDHQLGAKERKLKHNIDRNKEIMFLDERYLPEQQIKQLNESGV